jgi:hypothetical protein
MARSQSSAARSTKPEDPFKYGYRHLPNGDIVPLTEDDIIFPQEDDHIALTDEHDSDCSYLKSVFRRRTKGRQGLLVLADHGIDFQHEGLRMLAPDVTVLDDVRVEWRNKPSRFPVRDMKARVLLAIEVASPSTRRVDFGKKLGIYYRVGVPLYVICDPPYGGGKKPAGIVPYQAGAKGYEQIPTDGNGRFGLEAVGVSIGIEQGRVACYDALGQRIGDYEEVSEREQRQQARADEEKARADEEKARADEEKARADEFQARVKELEAQLKKAKRRRQ